jgi:hypothetical protein
MHNKHNLVYVCMNNKSKRKKVEKNCGAEIFDNDNFEADVSKECIKLIVKIC